MKDASFGEIFGKLSPPLLQSHPFAAEHAPLHKCTPPPPLFQEKFSFAKIKEGGLSHRVDIRRKRWHLTKESPLLSSLEFRHKIYRTAFKECVPFTKRGKGLMYHTFCIFSYFRINSAPLSSSHFASVIFMLFFFPRVGESPSYLW